MALFHAQGAIHETNRDACTLWCGRCLRETMKTAIEARSHRTATLGITDSEFSPIAKNCNSHLLVSVGHSSLAASYAAAECGAHFLCSHHAKAVATVSAGTERVRNLLPQSLCADAE